MDDKKNAENDNLGPKSKIISKGYQPKEIPKPENAAQHSEEADINFAKLNLPDDGPLNWAPVRKAYHYGPSLSDITTHEGLKPFQEDSTMILLKLSEKK